MSGFDSINLGKILEEVLLTHTKDRLIENIVRRHTQTFEEDLRSKIETEMESLTLEGISKFRDMYSIGEKLNIDFIWHNKNESA